MAKLISILISLLIAGALFAVPPKKNENKQGDKNKKTAVKPGAKKTKTNAKKSAKKNAPKKNKVKKSSSKT